MQRLASTLYGATMALVGQMVKQAVQLPQFSSTGLSTGNGKLIKSSPKKNQEPASLLRVRLCFPVQPIPAFSAMACSSTGAESTKGRYCVVDESISDSALVIFSPNCFKRLRNTLW